MKPSSRNAAALPLPAELYPDRRNSRGVDLSDPRTLAQLCAQLEQHRGQRYLGGPLLDTSAADGQLDAPPGEQAAATILIRSPANTREIVGESRDATPRQIEQAFTCANEAFPAWSATAVETRARALERTAELLEARYGLFLSLLVREAGKTIPDGVAEMREAVDFCRYYAARARELLAQDTLLPGPTGERNVLSLHGRGVFACISPWNFPLAIFAGQVTAALVTGNTVIAKPAPETPLLAHAFTRLLHEAGVPRSVLQLTPASGAEFASVAFRHPALAGVAFTGSTATAKSINRALSLREGAILPLIAETGGINAMLVDSTALPEQVVDDAIVSAFGSAGQRCSALRVLYLQDEIADRVIALLIGAMQELTIGDPARPDTDVGPVISARAKQLLEQHAERMRHEARLLYACTLDEGTGAGHYLAPQLFELRALDQLDTEAFGPLLHVARFRAEQLAEVHAAIRSTGYGLTLGVQSRRMRFADDTFRNTTAGNTYVNRNMVGAVVGVQPFGGSGLSGTGPKAGGPHYLLRFLTERTYTINTAAIGGNVDLVS